MNEAKFCHRGHSLKLGVPAEWHGIPAGLRSGLGAVFLVAALAAGVDAAAAQEEAREGEPRANCQADGVTPELFAEARSLLAEAPLVDGHNDLPWALRGAFENRLHEVDLRSDLGRLDDPLHTDIPRLRAGGMGAQFWSVYVPVDLAGSEAVQAVVEQIDVVHRLSELYPDVFELALTAADVERIHGAGRIASLIGIEGGHSIGDSLGVLRMLHALGARYMTITHWQNHNWADSATDDPEHDGLTAFGREVIAEMNRLGMLVDLSHVSARTMHQVLDVTAAPVIFSHSSAGTLNQHPRNVPDAVLERLADNGGVVMVTFVPSFISGQLWDHGATRGGVRERLKALHLGDPEAMENALAAWDAAHPEPRATLEQVADHIDHIRDRVGVEHVGIGSDFDGIGSTPLGLEDVSCFPALLGELLRRGYDRREVAMIAGGNVLRVMRRVEEVAERASGTRPSSDARIEDDLGDEPRGGE